MNLALWVPLGDGGDDEIGIGPPAPKFLVVVPVLSISTRSHRQSDYIPPRGGRKHCILGKRLGRPASPHRAGNGSNKAANAKAIPKRSRRSRSGRDPRSKRVSSLPGIRFQSERPVPKTKTHERKAVQTSIPAGVTDHSITIEVIRYSQTFLSMALSASLPQNTFSFPLSSSLPRMWWRTHEELRSLILPNLGCQFSKAGSERSRRFGMAAEMRNQSTRLRSYVRWAQSQVRALTIEISARPDDLPTRGNLQANTEICRNLVIPLLRISPSTRSCRAMFTPWGYGAARLTANSTAPRFG